MESYKDYLFILSPSKSIKAQVKTLKEETEELIGNYESRHSQAHVSIKALRRQKPYFTEPLFEQIEKELSLIEPFTLQLNGFATFLPTDFTTIYVAIKSTPEMEDWFKRLRKILTEKKAVPHITIARQVPNDKAKKLWPRFKIRQWNESFEVTSLTILQRETFGYDKAWKHFKEISFRGNPELNKWVDKKNEKEAEKLIDLNQTSLF
jgi:2'-5' RNA ligase